jgi:hypothetical protein
MPFHGAQIDRMKKSFLVFHREIGRQLDGQCNLPYHLCFGIPFDALDDPDVFVRDPAFLAE